MNEATRYKYPLQLPASLKETAIRLAREDGVSLNQWIVAAIAQKIGAVETAEEFFKRRGKSGDKDRLRRLLSKAPDTAPMAGDEIQEH